MKKWIKRISMMSMVLALVLCTTLTAFAQEPEMPMPDETVIGDVAETPVPETETEAEAETTEPAEEIPYSYVINEDGSVIITLNEAVTEEIKTTGTVVTENGGRLNLRTGAGMSNEIIDQLRPGEEVVVIGTEGDWYEVIVPEKTGYVHSDYLEVLETAQQNNNIDSALLAMIMQLMSDSIDGGVNEEPKNDGSFTPSGNMTLIDDYLQIEAEATEDEPQQDKQFITLQSKNGNTFYLVIDRNGETENVYFMNLVDEADLLALMEEGEDGTAATAPACSCTDKCAVGAIHTDCEICRTNMSECVGKESGVVLEPTEPDATDDKDAEKPKSNNFGTILILVVLGAVIAGGYFYFKIYKPKREAATDDDEDLEYVDEGTTVNEDETNQTEDDKAPYSDDEENYYADDDEE